MTLARNPILWLLYVLLAGGCTAPDRSTEMLQVPGFTEVVISGYEPFACGDDHFSTGFTALNPQGQRVAGTVCCGWLKSCTVRF